MRGEMPRRGFLGLLGGLGLLVGCAEVPTSGPVVRVQSSTEAPRRPGIDVAPQPPARGASPELILAGFLQAMTSSTDGYRLARQYLTTSAARDWDPESEAVIYDATQNKPVTTDRTAGLRAPIIARLDRGGRYRAAGGAVFDHDFGVVQVNGQWRISRPPRGLVVSQLTFSRSYRTVSLYFPGRRSAYLVPDLIHLPQAAATPTSAVTSLLSGPNSWLAGAVESVMPTGTKLSANSVPIDHGGIAVVSLTGEVTPLTDAQRRQMAGQMAWTLSSFGEVARVRLTTGGSNLSIPGAAEDDTVSTSLFTSMSPLISSEVPAMMATRDGRLVTVPDSGSPTPVAGLMGSAEAPRISSMAVERAGRRWALVDADAASLLLWTVGADSADILMHAAGLIRPQIATDGSIWTIGSRGAGSRIYAFSESGVQLKVQSPELATRRVLAFSLSPDLTRMALVVDADGGPRLAMARARPGATDPQQIIVDGLTELSLGIVDRGLTRVADVGWITTDSLIILARATADGPGSPFQLFLDGSGGTTIGPMSGTDMVALTTLPRADGINAMVLTADGDLLSYEDRYRWRQVLSGARQAAISF
ncbi:Lipoprotein LpqB [Acidipropionibacterium virtanenii]|uniref:Lipoprotein LpqB n=2 Tax=Acidipropionibacterium virtanenii TaxID=2057246 RepID=A0A344UTM3_9ACTN|nr:Lipoprotein LpqB [Acidipropionibacterium virtanenii]